MLPVAIGSQLTTPSLGPLHSIGDSGMAQMPRHLHPISCCQARILCRGCSRTTSKQRSASSDVSYFVESGFPARYWPSVSGSTRCVTFRDIKSLPVDFLKQEVCCFADPTFDFLVPAA